MRIDAKGSFFESFYSYVGKRNEDIMKNRHWIMGIVFSFVASLVSCGGGGSTTSQMVSTLAGSAGVLGALNGTGSTASFYTPFGITTDGTYLYVADTGNSTIREIVIATGLVTTLTGTAGVPGSTDGPLATARFYTPCGVVTYGGNVYVADTGNSTIREIVISTGTVSTLAGSPTVTGSADGTGSAALFSLPYGITTDGTNLYVADTGNSTIRKIVISTGTVSTLAGSPTVTGSTDGTGAAASFYHPAGITVFGTTLYVADTGNSTIREINLATGQVSTLAGSAGSSGSTDGTGTGARFNQPTGIVTDGTGTYLWVTDTGNSTIRRLTILSGDVMTVAGIAGALGSDNGPLISASFYRPTGITLYSPRFFISDTLNSIIRVIQ